VTKKDGKPGNILPLVEITDPEQAGLTLRSLAEDLLRKRGALSPESLKPLSPEEMQHMFHELRLHQIELEIQNEELRRIQAELEAAKDRYFDLYDLAPVGYLTVNEIGLIIEANLTAATQLSVTRNSLIQEPLTSFIVQEDQDIYYRHRKLLFETGAPQTCELRLLRKDGPSLWTLLQAVIAENGEKGQPVCRVVITDIHERKQAEEKLTMAYAELEVRVQERTSQLSLANAALSVEMSEHKQTEEDLRKCMTEDDPAKNIP
jgi:PAS domain S-box-containing protein